MDCISRNFGCQGWSDGGVKVSDCGRVNQDFHNGTLDTPNPPVASRLSPWKHGPPHQAPGRGVLESTWSPDAPKAPRGVHRSPRGLVLSLLFLVKIPASD